MVKPPCRSRVRGTTLYDERQGNARLIVPVSALIGWERTSSFACLSGRSEARLPPFGHLPFAPSLSSLARREAVCGGGVAVHTDQRRPGATGRLPHAAAHFPLDEGGGVIRRILHPFHVLRPSVLQAVLAHRAPSAHLPPKDRPCAVVYLATTTWRMGDGRMVARKRASSLLPHACSRPCWARTAWSSGGASTSMCPRTGHTSPAACSRCLATDL